MVKVFKRRKKIFKIGVMLGKRERGLVTIKDFCKPKQTHRIQEVAEISNTEYSNIINKYGKKAIGFIFYMRDHKDACDTAVNKKMREKCSGFGMIDLSLTINAKGKHSFFSGRELEVKVK